jgi:hypothetical protein
MSAWRRGALAKCVISLMIPKHRLHDTARMKTAMKKAPLPEPTRGLFLRDRQ